MLFAALLVPPLLACFYLWLVPSKATIITMDDGASPIVRSVLSRCPALTQSKFYPLPWLLGGHMQTMAASMLRPKPVVSYAREVVTLSDGGEAALDWCNNADGTVVSEGTYKAVVVILHGISGSSDERYVKHMVVTARKHALLPVVFICRGEANTTLKTSRTYSAGGTQDFREIVAHIKSTRASSLPLVAIGYSLGANILTRYISEDSARCPLAAAAAVSNPFNLASTADHLAHSLLGRALYEQHMLAGLKRYARRNAHMLVTSPAGDSLERAEHTTSPAEYAQLVTCKLWGLPTPRDYYEACSSSNGCLCDVRIPMLCLNALDDPLLSPEAIHGVAEDVRMACPWVVLALTSTGGHLGWLECGALQWLCPSGWLKPVRSWADRVCCEFLLAAL